jgi:malonate decarboxylase gamma subunit
VPEERLTELAKDNPVFAPGPENYLRMGGLHGIWEGDLAGKLARAIDDSPASDERMALGRERGGRLLAQAVAEAVRTGSHVRPS